MADTYSTIDAAVAAIRSATYGRDVRAGIADGIELINSKAESTITKADNADTVANKFNNMEVEAVAGLEPSVAISEVNGHKKLLFTLPKGEKFKIKKTFESVAEMNAYTGTDIEDFDFVFIDTGDVDDEDNASLYYYNHAANPKWTYIGDMSGIQGEKGDKGDTPVIKIGDVSTGLPSDSASVTITEDEHGDKLLNFRIPKGETGSIGNATAETIYMRDGSDTTIANELQATSNELVKKAKDEDIAYIIYGKRTSTAIPAGKYVVLKNSEITDRLDGLYTAKTAIPANEDIDGSYLNETGPANGGGLNKLSSDLISTMTTKINDHYQFIIVKQLSGSNPSVANNNTKVLAASITLTPGKWIVFAKTMFSSSSNTTGVRAMNLCLNRGGYSHATAGAIVTPPASSIGVPLSCYKYFNVSEEKTCDLYLFQTSGAALTFLAAQTTIVAIRIG